MRSKKDQNISIQPVKNIKQKNTLSFTWLLSEYGRNIQLSISGNATLVKDTVKSILGGLERIRALGMTEPPRPISNFAQFDIVLTTDARILVNLFHYLIQEHQSSPDFFPQIWREGLLINHINLMGEQQMGMPYYVAQLALDKAREKIKNGERFIFKPYTDEDILHAFPRSKVGQALIIENERTPQEQKNEVMIKIKKPGFFDQINEHNVNKNIKDSFETNTISPLLN
ncbi:MAG: hypothetical protein HYX60_10030 [Legionella longbeachae]|nr:hypothetical protein [Legionella longbeachae]